MYDTLKKLEKDGRKIRIAVIGAGSMGVGICHQIRHTPGMELVSISDINISAAKKAAEAYGKSYKIIKESDKVPKGSSKLIVTESPFFLIEKRPELRIDVIVEATNTIDFASRVCMSAISNRMHVVLMNAEVDLALGPLLHSEALKKNVIITSDAGDQHGVIMRMMDEIRLWAFHIVMAGNIKGFLNRYATAESLVYEAKIRNLNPIQCCAYTDGTKLCFEMSLISNATGLIPWVTGMEGPYAKDVHDVFKIFDFEKYGEQGVVDYIIGANPGGGVFVIGHCDEPIQKVYLNYYKMGDGPFYLFYRPYHLCHLETPVAIGSIMLCKNAIMAPKYGRISDVYAFAKRDIARDEFVGHAIGGDQFYGLIERCDIADRKGQVPIALLEGSDKEKAKIIRKIARDHMICYDDIQLPNTNLLRLFKQQKALLKVV